MVMITVQEAFTQAQAYVREVLGDKEYTLEEVEQDSYKGQAGLAHHSRVSKATHDGAGVDACNRGWFATRVQDGPGGCHDRSGDRDEAGELMTEFDRFDQNARARGIPIDTNLIVLLIVGSVNRERTPLFKRTSSYTPADWDLLTGILEQIPRRYAIPHVLSEVSALPDLKGPELEIARDILRQWILLIQALPISSLDASSSPYYQRLGLTDAALQLAAKQQGTPAWGIQNHWTTLQNALKRA
jgi:hypothetical protein